MGSASGGMRIDHVNAIRWAGSPRWAGNDGYTHAQTTLAPNQFSITESTITDNKSSHSKSKQTAAKANRGEENSGKRKPFKWKSEMDADLLACLKAYKAKMEFQGLDFDGDRPALSRLYLVFKTRKRGQPT